MNSIHGIFAVTVTHFNNDGSIDYSAISKHVQWLLQSGVHGIMPVGATGEWPALSTQERKQVAEFIMKEETAKVPVSWGPVPPM